ncbi:MAG: hypothetical protein RMX96_24705 [Nostoc sp. ChiSLP02]|nr:hypothetical protein [Nostoc sp. DedSLP05]MDZ8103209.1 hypothetical protein [Nostoc sp. DedSLP01]MDZ8188040.1 hypothetical protein [Nostoc sp. ChiSLP02]
MGGFSDLNVSEAVATEERHWHCVTPEGTASVNDLGALGYAITQRQLLQRR